MKHTPEIVIGTTVVVRAMSAEAAAKEDALLVDLYNAFNKADSLRNKAGEFEIQKVDVWNIMKAMMENRGIDLPDAVKNKVLQICLSPE